MMTAFMAGLGVAIGGFLALEFHDYRKRRRENPKETPSLSEIARSVLPSEKAEYLLPMTEAEYEAHMKSLTPQGQIENAVEEKWKSAQANSPSSDS